MQAKETRLQEIIEGTKQYVIPLFQRSYSWDNKNWEILWNDIAELAEMDNPRVHFMGSIVNMPTTSVPHGVAKYLLIDGQQRLTTIFIFLTLIRNKAIEAENQRLADKIHNTLLVNQYEDGNERYKLLPTQIDRNDYIQLIDSNIGEKSPITDAYNFFDKKLKSNPIELSKLLKIITDSLSVVSIVLDADDNPYLVFESLNGKGRQLTQADLIRNYFFMRIHQNKQDEVYMKYWLPIQTELGDTLPEFIRHYMMKEGGIIKLTDVYYTLKERVTEENAVDYIKSLKRYSIYYKSFINPDSESNEKLKECFIRLSRIEATTAYPVLLYFYGEYEDGNVSLDQFVDILKTLENYFIRRFICDYKTNLLNKIFPTAYQYIVDYRLGTEDQAFRSFLSEHSYPKDGEFKTKFKQSQLYGGGDRKAKTRFILESLEQSYHHKEKIDTSNLSIEHIMPQTLSEWWQNNLGDDWEDIHDEWLNTIGNLTLTAYNSELSNDNYDTKREIYAESHLELNKYLASVGKWNREQILRRAEMLTDKAIEIWPYFGDSDAESEDEGSITGSNPYCVELLGQEFSVTTWRDVFELTMNMIYELEPQKFDAIAEMQSKYIDKDKNKFRAIRQLKNDYFIEVNLSAEKIYKICLDVLKAIGLTNADWIVKYKSGNSEGEATVEGRKSKSSKADTSFIPGLFDNEGDLDIVEIRKEYKERQEAPSKYSLNGSPFMKANFFVHKVVYEYWKNHREATFNELKKVFPDPEVAGSFGTIRSLEFIENRGYKGTRYFLDPDMIMESSDGIKFAVSTEWSWHNAPAFALHARNLGFEVEAINKRKRGDSE